MTKKLTRRVVIGIACTACIGALAYPPLFVRVRERSRLTGGARSRALSEENRQLAREFQVALARGDFNSAEKTLQTWKHLPGVYGENVGYWTCVVRLRTMQNRWAEVADAYQHIDTLESTLRTSPAFLSAWATASARAGRMQDIPPIYVRLAETSEFQQEKLLSTLPLARFARDSHTVEALDATLRGKSLLSTQHYEAARKSLKEAVELCPDLTVSQQLLEQAVHAQEKTRGA